jgi:hypothetical protein
LGKGKFVFSRDKLGVVNNTFLGKRDVKIIKKYLGKCLSSPRRLRGEKMPNVDPSHLIYEM